MYFIPLLDLLIISFFQFSNRVDNETFFFFFAMQKFSLPWFRKERLRCRQNDMEHTSRTFVFGKQEKSAKDVNILNYNEKVFAKWPPKLLNEIVPSSAFCNHSTNFFIWSRKTLLPLATCASLYHFKIASSLSTSAAISSQRF